jgi:hypothetical protein
MMEKSHAQIPIFQENPWGAGIFYEPIRCRRRDKSHQKDVSKPKRIVIGGWYAFTLPKFGFSPA